MLIIYCAEYKIFINDKNNPVENRSRVIRSLKVEGQRILTEKNRERKGEFLKQITLSQLPKTQ